MFDIVLDYIKNIIKSRILPLLLVYVVLFSTLIYRIFELQIMDQEEIVAEHEKEYKKEEIFTIATAFCWLITSCLILLL